MEIQIFLLWNILAILVGVYASSKGRSGIGFFFIAMLLSPLIGFFIALVVQPIRAKTEAKAIGNGSLTTYTWSLMQDLMKLRQSVEIS